MGILKWTQGQLDSLVTVLNSKAKQADLVSGLSSKASAIHNHDTLYASINNAVPSVTGNNGKFLSTDGATASWKDPKEVINLADGKDVTITSPLAGQLLKWDGTQWINSAVPAATATVYGGVKVSLSGTTLTITV